ncbi:STM3941 family protein [Aequorivita sp. CIP111184]|uniref:STM3941 family protein n=1 Tax=Aequorivita sp. CIP111184 TaxID=2211356 RepID=UPI000DBC1C80|nr:STM3941 family protein [Aequorivita sp. CIP111184]SRX53819.1 hypothetical protein AEQU1_00898 [Aequorivita sp. CIP111184]
MKEETLILKPKKITTIIWLLICTLFVITGFTVMDEKILVKWVGIIFFGLGIIVFIIELFPNSAYLKLSNEGFEVCSLYRSNFTKWEEVDGFGIFYIRFHAMVVFNYTGEHKKHKTGKKVARFLSSYQGALPQTYGVKTIKLAELMNEWKFKNEK